MSDFSAHHALEDAQERSEHSRANPTVAIAAAILAVLAALATMFAHSRSTTGLVEKNEAILAQAKASDLYNYYESKRIKHHLYAALHDAGLGDRKVQQQLQSIAAKEQRDAGPILVRARALEADATRYEASSELALKAYETFEIAVTLFEVSIVFVSISALAGSRNLLFIAGGTSAIGIIFLVIGFLHHL